MCVRRGGVVRKVRGDSLNVPLLLPFSVLRILQNYHALLTLTFKIVGSFKIHNSEGILELQQDGLACNVVITNHGKLKLNL